MRGGCIRFAVSVAFAMLPLSACQPADRLQEPTPTHPAEAASQDARAHIVDVVALDFAFEAPCEIPSGWTTFRMKNAGQMIHFALLTRLPEGITFTQYLETVVPAFDQVWLQLRDGKIDQAQAGQDLGRLLPEWYLSSAKQMGGPGFVAPGLTAETTVNLDAGTYVMECYVKTADGTFHTSLGMIRPLTVTEVLSAASAPDADIQITLTNYEMAVEGTLTPGAHTVAVHFEEHPEFGLGNDVHLARLDADTDIGTLVEWLNWMNIGGLQPPAPALFVGGTHEMPVGNTAYFTVTLEPGRYVWIAESTAAQGMLNEFVVE